MLPIHVATTFREIAWGTLKKILEGYSNQACQPIANNKEEFVKFNGLFYNTTEAASVGTIHDSLPYEDSIATTKRWFDLSKQ